MILVDDSIVRGTTVGRSSRWCAGRRHARCTCASPSPPTTHSCFYGIDTPERGKLLAARYDVDDMAKFIGVDSLAFISIDGLYRALGKPGRDPAQAAILRRLLHRRLSDRAAGSGGQCRPAVDPAGREPADEPRWTARRPRRAGHRRQPRHRRAAAVELARLGAHVVLTARTAGRPGGDRRRDPRRWRHATLLPLDLTDGEQVDALGPSSRALRPARRSGSRRRRARAR